MPHLIVFVGVEGVGKSTQICSLKKWFSDLNIDKMKVIDIRGNCLFAYAFWRMLTLLGRTSRYKRPDGSITEGPDNNILQSTCKFWFVLILFSTLPVILVKVYFPLLLGYTVIAERYVIDTLSDFQRLGDVFLIRNSRIVSFSDFLLSFIPKRSIVINIRAEYPELVHRYQKRKTPLEWQDYVHARTKYYDSVLEDLKNKRPEVSCLRIDSTLDSEKATSSKIQSFIQRIETENV